MSRRRAGLARPAALVLLGAVAVSSCSGSPHRTVAALVASLPKASTDKPAGPFLVGHVPPGHVIDTVTRGKSETAGASKWCVHKVCASAAFSDWRGLVWSGVGVSGPRDAWPAGSYVEVFDAPAPRVDDRRKALLPTGTAIDVAMLPGSRADLALGASYNVMATDTGEHGPAHDVWFERRLVHVGTKEAVLTESYGSDESFPRDTKTLYFEGPHGELGVVRATTDIFFGSDIWSRIVGGAARLRAAHREAAALQISDTELIAVAASVRRATGAQFAAAARGVAANRVCALDLRHKNARDERLIAAGRLANGQEWSLRQGRDAAGDAVCPRDATTCAHQLGSCFAWYPEWGDWQRSAAHPVYFEFLSPANGIRMLFAVAPDVRTLRITQRTNRGKESPATTVPTETGINGVRWAFSPVSAYKVTALDGAGNALETVRADLTGP